MIDIEKLKAAALAATPGEWKLWQGWVAVDVDNDGGVIICERPRRSGGRFQKSVDANFAHIATANPYAIRELIERLEKAEKDATAINELIAKAGEVMRQKAINKCWHDHTTVPIADEIRALSGVTLEDLK